MKALCSVLCLGACASMAAASAIRSPVAVISNSAGEFGPDAAIGTTIDHSGLITPFSNGDDFDAYMSGGPLHSLIYAFQEWFSPGGGESFSSIVYDLGADYTVDRLAYWNEDAGGVAGVTVTTSLNGTFGDAIGAGSFAPTDWTGGLDYGADVHAFAARGARYIRVDVSGIPSSSVWPGLSMGEIAFSTNPIPAPGAAALLGVAGLVGLRRRR
jgi:uncharacterized protein (TIGR03382 family)